MKMLLRLSFTVLLAVMALSGCGGGGGEGGGAPASSAKAITAFSLDGVAGTINETAKTISVTMPYGTNVTALVATFTSTGASVKVGSAVQTSGTTANDFTNPVSYTVTAADGTTAAYTVTVTVAPSSAKAITAFSLDGVAGTINETAKTISVTMPYGTNVTALVATFTSTGASVKVGSAVQTSGTTANDFTNPVSYTVTAADGTTAAYAVTVTVAPSSAKAITAFSLDGVAGTINETAKTISVTMPYGANVTALVATFTSTGASVKVGSAVQTSGTTANDFTNPVSYTVTAADGTIAAYTVTVTVALSSAKAITAFSLDGVAGTINETAKTISVAMPYGTNVTAVTALVATFATTGESVTVGSAVQTSGTTANDFTSPVSYTVTAADGTTATYTVTVTVGKLPDTGQTGDYTATIGEDSDYTINSPSYTDNGDGTITDNVTKLTWQKCSPGQSGADCAAGTATEYSWDNAGTACAGLGTGWRLPTRMELLTIADYGVSAPAINGVSFPGTITWYYWTSTTYAGGTTNAWVVAFGGGTADWYDKTSVNYVRCVRGQ